MFPRRLALCKHLLDRSAHDLGGVGVTARKRTQVIACLLHRHVRRQRRDVRVAHHFDHDRAFLWLVLSRFLFLLGTYGIGRSLLFIVAERLQ